MNKTVNWTLMLCLLGGGALGGCDDTKSGVTVAPTADKLDAPKSKSATAVTFEVQKSGSKVEFAMEAPIEKITGKVNDATVGEANIDLSDLTKSTGKITVDISSIELFQRKKEKADGEFGAEVKNGTQNEHARAWLQINDENKDHDKNRRVEFSFDSVKTDTPDVTKLTGDERTVKATLTGKENFLLHGHKTTKTVDVEVTFKFKDGKAVSMHVKTAKPFAVPLAENEVMPRDTVGKLLEKGLSALSEKVAKDAMVSIDFTAEVKGGSSGTSAAPSASAAAATPSARATSSAAAAPSASAAPSADKKAAGKTAPRKAY